MRYSSHASKRKMLHWKHRVALLFLTRQNGALEKKEEKSAQVAISMGSPSSFVVDTALGGKIIPSLHLSTFMSRFVSVGGPPPTPTLNTPGSFSLLHFSGKRLHLPLPLLDVIKINLPLSPNSHFRTGGGRAWFYCLCRRHTRTNFPPNQTR